jgi:hypothetical protein
LASCSVQHRLVLQRGQAGVEHRGPADGRLAQLLQPLHLVALQRDQRRDDQHRAVQQEPGDGVDGRLAGSRRQDGEGVLAGGDGLHRLLLAGAEVGEAQHLLGGLPDPPGAHGRRAAGLGRGVGGTLGGRGHRRRLPGP